MKAFTHKKLQNFFGITFLATLFSATALTAGENTSVVPMNLQQAILYAIDHSPSINSAQREYSISELEYKNAISKFLPSLDLTAEHGARRNIPNTTSTPWTSQLTLALTETLFDNGANITNARIARMKKEQSEIALSKGRNRLCLDVGLEFFRYSLAMKVLEIQEYQFKMLSKKFDLVSADYHQGLKSKKDFLRFKTQANRANIDLVNAKNAVEMSRQELQRLLGLTIDQGMKFVVDEEKIDFKNIPTQASAFDKHYDVENANIQKEVNRLSASLTTRKYWPEVFLTTGASYQAANYIDTGPSNVRSVQKNWNALLTVKYNIFDWGIRWRDSEIANERREIQGNELDQKVLTVKKEINNLLLEMKQYQENFGLSEELLKLEQANTDLLEEEYRQGKASSWTYMTGLEDLASAKIKYFTSLFELKKIFFSYQYHEGTLYEAITKK